MPNAKLVMLTRAELLDTWNDLLFILYVLGICSEADNIRSLSGNFSKREVQCDEREGQPDGGVYLALLRR